MMYIDHQTKKLMEDTRKQVSKLWIELMEHIEIHEIDIMDNSIGITKIFKASTHLKTLLDHCINDYDKKFIQSLDRLVAKGEELGLYNDKEETK